MIAVNFLSSKDTDEELVIYSKSEIFYVGYMDEFLYSTFYYLLYAKKGKNISYVRFEI